MILIYQCNLFLQCNIGTRLLKNCNKRSKENFQGTKQCAKNKRNFLNFDYKKIVNYHKGIKIILIFGICCLKRKKCIIYFVSSIRRFMNQLNHFKEIRVSLFLYILRTSMLKVIESMD
jgi:hypothetical protein